MSRTRSKKNYSSKMNFETRRENQDFERQENSTSRPPLDSTPFGNKVTNIPTSPINSIIVGTKTPEPMPQTQPKDSPTLPRDA